jgi:hypothetical protein
MKTAPRFPTARALQPLEAGAWRADRRAMHGVKKGGR